MNSVDPLDWLSQTMTRIAQGWPASEIEMLMPWNFGPDVIELTAYRKKPGGLCSTKDSYSRCHRQQRNHPVAG
ncbi:transposase domain-containing protein [Mesorhizobium japonicum]|uniref:transposase domain-containing protein n=1 Tax=Mesorhizobium TaxID=68287 RepID=UPI001FEF8E59|nr:transposase domain-containing protein [Mesorhizobium japonicum]